MGYQNVACAGNARTRFRAGIVTDALRAVLPFEPARYPPEPLGDAQRAVRAVATYGATIPVGELAARLGRQRIPILTAVYIPSEPGRYPSEPHGYIVAASLSRTHALRPWSAPGPKGIPRRETGIEERFG